MKKDRDSYSDIDYNSYYEQERGEAEILHDTRKDNKKKIFLISILLLSLGALGYTGYKVFNFGEEDNATLNEIENLTQTQATQLDMNSSEVNDTITQFLSAEMMEAEAMNGGENKNATVDESALKANIAKETKTVDVYNKVVVDNNNSKDDLTSKIDSAVGVNQGSANAEYSSEIATRENQLSVIVVQKGDTLGDLAQKAYGDASQYRKIFEANPSLKSPNRLYVGQKLNVPQ